MVEWTKDSKERTLKATVAFRLRGNYIHPGGHLGAEPQFWGLVGC